MGSSPANANPNTTVRAPTTISMVRAWTSRMRPNCPAAYAMRVKTAVNPATNPAAPARVRQRGAVTSVPVSPVTYDR